MNSIFGANLSRRQFLSAGALTVAFSLAGPVLGQEGAANESLKTNPFLDAWIQVNADGRFIVCTGKVELGTGVRTALMQVAAEELDVPVARIELIMADTQRTPNEGLTAGSHTLMVSGTAIQNAAANVRGLLMKAAAQALETDIATLSTNGNGEVVGPAGKKVSYAILAATLSLHVAAVPNIPLRDPTSYRTMGKAVPRVDIPAKLTGGRAFVQDMRLPAMLHARVARGPSEGTHLVSPNVASVRQREGVFQVIQKGRFLAVVAENEWTAIMAMRELQAGASLRTSPPLPNGDLLANLKDTPLEDIVILDTSGPTAPPVRTVRARYSRPWLSHGSIGPSCSLAFFKDGVLTVWTHSQGTFDVQRTVAELVGLQQDKVHAIHVEGAGCYGQNGADDVAADAAVVAMAIPDRPIRLQWMREQEFGWEPLGPGMSTELEASLDAEHRIVFWKHEIWSNRHNARPTTAGRTWAGSELDPPFPEQKGKPIPMPEGDASRNSNPLYALPTTHVVFHYIPAMPVRVSSLRSLGAHLNVFSIESMFDELAKTAGVDPLALRLAHMEDQRARDVMQSAADHFGWSKRTKGDGQRGCGFAFARYKNIGAYCAIALEVNVERETGRAQVIRVVAAVDSGQAVNPDGIRNQVEGGIIQSLSWTTREAATFDITRREIFDWSSYPIARFNDVPSSIDIHIINRPGMPFLGTGETAQGPAGAAFANALADATGVRLRDMPLSASRIKAAIGPI
jgi:CO/xanthine dehydrogenase Mo-binding subunit